MKALYNRIDKRTSCWTKELKRATVNSMARNIFLTTVSNIVNKGVVNVQTNVQLNVEKDILTVPDMVEILEVSRSMVYTMVNSGQIPYVRVGSKVRFVKSQIEVWLADGGSKEEVV